MRVYTCIESAVEEGDRIKHINDLDALSYHVFICIPLGGWASEESLIESCRRHYYYIFKRISDQKIVSILLNLCLKEYIRKEDVITDLEEDISNNSYPTTSFYVTSLGGLSKSE